MDYFIHLFILLPVIGFLISIFIPNQKEKLISNVVYTTVGLHFLTALLFTIYWLWNGGEVINVKDISLFKSDEYDFFIDIFFDKVTATYLLVGAMLTFLIATYSRYYLHRESGYKRFFNTILFFYIGYNTVIFAGNFETLFIGWEILGITSFLLIAFYRDRYLPVKNAVKVYSIYRIGDVGLILAMWASHHLWHENITFLKLSNKVLVHDHLEGHSWIGIFISMMILLAAIAKSAQLPFSSWLPRAMEGPTPSSAIFYGSLSVHLGVFMLLRTHTFWENQYIVRVLIGLIGLSTAIVTEFIARVQPNVKSKIAYASAAQIGLIFVEIALGLDRIALIHFAGNAFLRTYQLLVSPSVVSYLIREQFYNFTPKRQAIEDSFPKKLEYSLYLLSVKEWNLDEFTNTIIWKPLKRLGSKLSFLTIQNILYYFIPTYLGGLLLLFFENKIPPVIHQFIPACFAFIGLISVLRSFGERQSARIAWLLIVINHLWILLAVAFNQVLSADEIAFYMSGVIISSILGYFALYKLKQKEQKLPLRQFYGYVYEYPSIGFLFFIACLGLAGFPITPTFIGIDLLFSHIEKHQFALAIFTSLSFIITGISLIRIYARLFLGPHIKTYHETPFKSS
jgi:NADH:ubiquinone oxidoreductase subunit 5 (subunit L)/multisubunit Na+/H+ antiporter MnhA subunit